jgi:signal transduction histidine kinase
VRVTTVGLRRWLIAAVGCVTLAGTTLIVIELDDPLSRSSLAVAIGLLVAVTVWLVVTGYRAEERFVALVAELQTAGPADTLRNALRRSLRDPGLDIVYLRAGSGGWIDEDGRSMTRPVPRNDRAVTPIERGGKPIAALVHDPALLRHPARLRAAIEAATLAFGNERTKADLRAQIDDLRASRARIMDATDRDRRRAERDLHDGAQQRLVGLALMLRLASRKAANDPAVTALLDEAVSELERALGELRQLVRGIHPAIVATAGLARALETLAERPGLPVELEVDVPVPLPAVVETDVYYLVAEALANASKHAEGTRVSVRVAVRDDTVQVRVEDDGRGGAAATAGSGLDGLADRVDALGGRLSIVSDDGHGTTISAVIPVAGRPVAVVDQRRQTALCWLGWETYEIPAEAYDQLVEEDNLTWALAVYACAGGVSGINQVQREWIVGYMAAAGNSEWVLDALRAHDRDDSIEAALAASGVAHASRGFLYDTIRMFSADGDLTSAELRQVHRAAGELGLTQDVVADLLRIVADERELRRRRYEAITAPVLPT